MYTYNNNSVVENFSLPSKFKGLTKPQQALAVLLAVIIVVLLGLGVRYLIRYLKNRQRLI